MSSEAFVWSEALAGKPVSRAAKRVMNEATEFGMFDGYSVAAALRRRVSGDCHFGARKVDLSGRAARRAAHHFQSMRTTGCVPSWTMGANAMNAAAVAKVTPREREVILWCAAARPIGRSARPWNL